MNILSLSPQSDETEVEVPPNEDEQLEEPVETVDPNPDEAKEEVPAAPPQKRGRGRPRKDPNAPPKAKGGPKTKRAKVVINSRTHLITTILSLLDGRL